MRSVLAFDPLQPRYRRDPYPVLHRLRRAGAVHRTVPFGATIVLTHALALEVLRDTRRFSSDPSTVRSVGNLPRSIARRRVPFAEVPSLSTMDPPAHARLRRVLSRPLSAGAVEAFRPRIREAVARLLPPRGDPVELMTGFAEPLAAAVLLELAGGPADRQGEIGAWLRAIGRVREAGWFSEADLGRAWAAVPRLTRFVEEVRAGSAPPAKPNLLLELLEAESGGRITLAELLALLVHVALVGTGPTAGLIGNAVVALARWRDAREMLRKEPALWPSAVDELLRYDSPTHAIARVARCDLALGGVEVAAGEVVFVMVGAANRDPAVFPEPDLLDVRREAQHHLAFGAGPHLCLGAPLARLIAEEALPLLLERIGEYRIRSLQWDPAFELRAPRELVVEQR